MDDQHLDDQTLLQSWSEGPYWLQKDVEDWPSWGSEVTLAEEQEEQRFGKADFEEKNIILTVVEAENNLLDVSQYNSVVDLMEATVEKFNMSNTEEAKSFWEKRTQEEVFPDVIKLCEKKKQNDLIRVLRLELDQKGILWCKGRFRHSDLHCPEPILLLKNHPFLNLIIKSEHVNNEHCGPAQTLAQVRKRYWIVTG